jgi:hypothetical protein
VLCVTREKFIEEVNIAVGLKDEEKFARFGGRGGWKGRHIKNKTSCKSHAKVGTCMIITC